MDIIIILIVIFLIVNKYKRRMTNAAKSGNPRPVPKGEAAGFRDFAEAMRALAQDATRQAAPPPEIPVIPAEVPEEPHGEELREAPRPIPQPAPRTIPRRVTRSMHAQAAARLKQVVQHRPAADLPGRVDEPTYTMPEVDEEGCVGGSMAHAHTEGESRAEHARHQAEAARLEAEEQLVRAEAERRAATGVQALRRAVVMAEVLGKPKALRRGN